jgi:hypothetical protein
MQSSPTFIGPRRKGIVEMINQGMYVRHLHRSEWGVGKVLEGHPGTMLRLWFESGGERKIGSEYHGMLQQVSAPQSFHVPSVKSSPPKASAADKFQRDYFNGRWEFTFSRQERTRFKAGHLVRQWAEQYPFLFGPEDVEVALAHDGKGSGVFFEWVSAVRLYETRGYYCAMKDYASPLQHSKHEIVRTLCGEEAAVFMAEADAKSQFPDLLVYTPDHSEWFFCEVKGPGDTVRKSEETFFPKLAERTAAGIFLVTLSLA